MKNIRQLSKAYIREITEKLILENKERKTPKFELDKFQQKLIDSRAKYIRIIAPAGSGKTRTLIAKAVEELKLDSKAQILCLTFTNAAVDEFKKRAKKIDKSDADRLKISTLNSFGFSILKDVCQNLEIVAPNKKRIGTVYFHIKNLLLQHKKIKRHNNETYPVILELSDITKSLGFDHEDDSSEMKEHFEHIEALGMFPLIQSKLSEIGIDDNSASSFLEVWIPFWKEFVERLWESNLITFDDQKYWCLNQLIFNEHLVQKFKKQGFTHILIDEFQDINLLDLYLISQIAWISEASIIIVGDDDQCIYEWRGCTSHIIQNPNFYFKPILNNNTFEEIELSKNYRCPRNIVVHSSHLISKNKQRIEKEMIPVRKDDANIRVIPLPAAYITLNVVVELVSNIVEKHPKHTVAIVGRKKSQLIPIQVLLTRDEINFSIDSDLNVFDGAAFKSFRQFLELPLIYTKKQKPIQIIENLLSLIDQVGKFAVSESIKTAITNWVKDYRPETLKDAVEAFAWYDGLFMGKYKEPRDVAQELDSFLSKETVVDALNSASKIFRGLQKNFLKSKEDIFYSDPPFSYLADLAVGYDADFKLFLNDIDKAIAKADASNPQSSKVELMTALRTKGREFDTVIVLDVNDGIWPNRLAEEAGRKEEERRLFYVTVTRTKNNLLLFDSGRVQGEQMSTSPFIKNLKLPESAWLRLPEYNKISAELLDQLKI